MSPFIVKEKMQKSFEHVLDFDRLNHEHLIVQNAKDS